MSVTLAVLCGFLLDLVLGDPVIPHAPHPVVVIGRCITKAEARLRALFPDTEKGLLAAGRVLAVFIPLLTFLGTFTVCAVTARLHPALGFFAQALWCWQALAMKDLKKESMNVYKQLTQGSLQDARRAVQRIVGRDTENLSAEGVAKAAVETVAENFSDGVVAPLFYMLIGGAPLALCYKAINTMDSMVGYKNEKYLWFGRAAARLDDAANYLPARLAALLWIAAAGLAGQDAKGAWKIWRRDRRKHASPNAGMCEAACAGALGVRLAGPASYFGKPVEKPYIGDEGRPVEAEDIVRADKTLYIAGVLALVLGLALRAALLLLWR